MIEFSYFHLDVLISPRYSLSLLPLSSLIIPVSLLYLKSGWLGLFVCFFNQCQGLIFWSQDILAPWASQLCPGPSFFKTQYEVLRSTFEPTILFHIYNLTYHEVKMYNFILCSATPRDQWECQGWKPDTSIKFGLLTLKNIKKFCPLGKKKIRDLTLRSMENDWLSFITKGMNNFEMKCQKFVPSFGSFPKSR